jgi:hypothetical protein
VDAPEALPRLHRGGAVNKATQLTRLPCIDLRWGQADPAPYLVPIPRVPCAGEKMTGPDDVFTLEVGVRYVDEHRVGAHHSWHDVEKRRPAPLTR